MSRIIFKTFYSRSCSPSQATKQTHHIRWQILKWGILKQITNSYKQFYICVYICVWFFAYACTLLWEWEKLYFGKKTLPSFTFSCYVCMSKTVSFVHPMLRAALQLSV